MLKKIAVFLLAAILFVTVFTSTASAAYLKKVSTVNDAMSYARYGDPMSISKGTLYNGSKRIKNVYVIGLTGTNGSFDPKIVNGIYSCLFAGTSIPNSYLKEAKKQAEKYIPEGATVVLYGHSLGGMVAQQFAADKKMKEKYNIINIVTLGSPYILEFKRDGELHRMLDSGDAIPFMSTAAIANAWAGNAVYMNNGYFGNPDKAHNVSYEKADGWRDYDCFGIKDGNSAIYIYDILYKA